MKILIIGIFCFVDGVKIDLVKHPHPLLGPVESIDDIRFFSDRDIMAMKIQAILGRGKKDRTVAISGWINAHLR